MKYTEYFLHTRKRAERSCIQDTWIEEALDNPVHEEIQTDGRIRRWVWIETEQKYLRIVLLPDAFFDCRFKGVKK